MREETAFYAHTTRFLLGEKHNFAVLKAYVLFELVYTTTQRIKTTVSCRKVVRVVANITTA